MKKMDFVIYLGYFQRLCRFVRLYGVNNQEMFRQHAEEYGHRTRPYSIHLYMIRDKVELRDEMVTTTKR